MLTFIHYIWCVVCLWVRVRANQWHTHRPQCRLCDYWLKYCRSQNVHEEELSLSIDTRRPTPSQLCCTWPWPLVSTWRTPSPWSTYCKYWTNSAHGTIALLHHPSRSCSQRLLLFDESFPHRFSAGGQLCATLPGPSWTLGTWKLSCCRMWETAQQSHGGQADTRSQQVQSGGLESCSRDQAKNFSQAAFCTWSELCVMKTQTAGDFPVLVVSDMAWVESSFPNCSPSLIFNPWFTVSVTADLSGKSVLNTAQRNKLYLFTYCCVISRGAARACWTLFWDVKR